MILRTITLILLCLGSNANSSTRPQDMQLTRKFSQILAHRNSLNEAGDGLFILWLSVKNSKNLSNPDVQAEFTPATGGQSVLVDARLGTGSVVRLPAGRYCLSAVLQDQKRFKNKCEAPFFDVTAYSVDVSGQLEITLGWKKLSIIDRRVDNMVDALHLSKSQLLEVNDYLRQQERNSRLTLFGSGPLEQPFIMRFFPGGIAEIEEFSLASASYNRGKWDAEKLQAIFYDGNTRYFLGATDVASSTKLVRGLLETKDQQNFEFDEQLAMAPNIECWRWDQCGNRITPGIVLDTNFNFFNSASPLFGELELTYQLKSEGQIAWPNHVKVINYTMSRKQAQEIARRFEETAFLPEKDENGARKRCLIKFEAIGSRARANIIVLQ